MFRLVASLMLLVVVIALIRGVIGIVARAVTNAMRVTQPNPPQQPAEPAQTAKLIRDPVCGTFVSADSAIRQIRGGETFCFCSQICRQRFLAGAR